MPQVKQGSTVLVHYTVTAKDGEVVESTAGGEPLRVTVGAGKVLRSLEQALVGMGPGESKRVVIPPEQGFGRRNPTAASRHSMDTAAPVGDRPAEFQRQVVNMTTPDEFSVVVTDRGITVDRNPHLAGKELVLDIELVDIQR